MNVDEDDKYVYAVAGVIIKKGDTLILQHRDDKPNIENPGTYSPWGGKIEDGEDPLQAAIRELCEETGVVVQVSDLRLLSEHDEETTRPGYEGKKVKASIYLAEIGEDVEVNCFEGQGKVEITSKADVPNGKLYDGLERALDIYFSGSF